MFEAKWCLMLLSVFILTLGASCATVEKATGTHTYVVTGDQLQQVREMLKIEPCPEGQSALALTMQSASGGGATVTVRCQ